MTSSQVQEPLRWLFGDLFERRIQYELAHHELVWSRLARDLVSGGQTADQWRQRVGAYRTALLMPDEAPIKVAEDLPIGSDDFDEKLMDVLAEVASVVHLEQQGAVRFRPKPRSALRTPDFTCEWTGVETALEVKNLRAHNFIEDVLLDLYLDAGLKSGKVPALVIQRSDRNWLSRDEIAELRALVQRLPEYAVGQVHTARLRSGKVFAFRLEQEGASRCEAAIAVDDLECDSDFRDGLLKKIVRVVTNATDQLLSPSVQHVQRRVVAMRWDIPSYGVLQDRDLPEAIRGAILSTLSGASQPIEAVLFDDFSERLIVCR